MKYIITAVCDSEETLDADQLAALSAEVFEVLDEQAHLPFGFEVRIVSVADG